jgi:hypothetical protein
MASIVKMATVFEECTNEEQRSAVRVLWSKGLSAKGIHKEMFPVYCRKFLSRKAVHNCGSVCDISQKTSMLRVWTH